MSSGSRISPIQIFVQNLHHINTLFNISLKQNQMEAGNYAPIFKLGFLGNGSHYLDRMFTIEERNGIIFFVRNVQFGDEKNEYRRSVYSIIKDKTLYVHYTTGILFKDLFDYAHIEPTEISETLYFYYNDKYYNTIKEISDQDPINYKTKTIIVSKIKQIEIPNDMLIYGSFFGLTSQLKVGYYIPEENIPYYHVILFMGKQFGLVPNASHFFQSIANDPNGMYTVVNTVFLDPRQYGQAKLNKSGNLKKQSKNNPYVGVNLINKLSSEKILQNKRFIVGWFLCEIMYQFFFSDAW